ncbi:hypothetical protein Tco_0450440 [Tanacetum coccineum]
MALIPPVEPFLAQGELDLIEVGIRLNLFRFRSEVLGFRPKALGSRPEALGLRGSELETLISTYDIPLDLRPHLPDPNFRMINLPVGDTAIGAYLPASSSRFEQGGYIRGPLLKDPAPVCMEGVKSGLKLWKEKFLLIDRRAIPFHMPWRHPDSCVTDEVPTDFHQDYVNRIKAHIVKLYDILEGVLFLSGLIRMYQTNISFFTIMSIYDFLCMPSLDGGAVREEPHGLDTSILDGVADHTTSPALAGASIPRATLEETIVTRPDRKVVTKADNAAKQKASSRPEVSTNVTKKTKSSKKGTRAGSTGQAARGGVDQVDDDTLDDGDQRDDTEFAMEDIESVNDVIQGEHINVILLQTFDPSIGLDVTYPLILLPDKEVKPHVELSGGVRKTTRASFCASHGKLVSLLTSPLDYTKNGSDDNVDPYYEAQVCYTAGDVLEGDLFPLVPGPYYTPYPYDEELYKDPKFTVHANEEVSRLKTQLGVLESKCQTTDKKLSGWDKKHRKYKVETDAIAIEKAKVEEELVRLNSTPLVRELLKSGEFNQAFAGALAMSISVGVES